MIRVYLPIILHSHPYGPVPLDYDDGTSTVKAGKGSTALRKDAPFSDNELETIKRVVNRWKKCNGTETVGNGNPILASFATKLLPYIGLGTGGMERFCSDRLKLKIFYLTLALKMDKIELYFVKYSQIGVKNAY
ncbi:MAG: hypothetical protein U5P10_14905 [Spirochaetia bacterium]|nr:hypothetical protein [Spirochaetia bacterium]